MARSAALHFAAGLFLTPVLLLASLTADAADSDRPNVLFMMIDQYRADRIGAYEGGKNIRTPHIDRLAEEGMLFENRISSAPLCTLYRGMLITGRYPTRAPGWC